MSAEAKKVLRAFPTKSSEKEGPKPMPSFPDMVAYVQEKVNLCAYFSLIHVKHPLLLKLILNLKPFYLVIIRLLRG